MQNKKHGHNYQQSLSHEIYRSRALGQGVCLNGMSRTITLQGFALAAITDAEKTKPRHKITIINGQ